MLVVKTWPPEGGGGGAEQWHGENFAQSLCGTVPPASLSGDFVSPVDIRWFEVSPSLSSLDGAPGAVKEGGGERGGHDCNFMQSTVPIYWELDTRVGTEFIVDITGPDVGERYQPVTLQVCALALCISVCLSLVSLSASLSLCLSVSLPLCLSASLPLCLSAGRPSPPQNQNYYKLYY
jgi:hypothetical protein